MSQDRSILHVDMDAFFAAIEQLDDPHLKGRPVLVGSDSPRGVVCTASYEARPFGCGSAMPMAMAKRLCPQAVVVPVRGKRYREVSQELFEIFAQYSPLVEPLSIDEAFIDLTGTQRLWGSSVEVARRIKRQIKEQLHLTASVGVAFNKFLAKLASDMDKPDGLTVIDRNNLDATLLPLAVGRLWGVGPAMVERFAALGIKNVADLRQFSEEQLFGHFGQAGKHCYRLARGIDYRPVVGDEQAKSIGQEQTFARDMADPQQVRMVLLAQVENISRRLRKAGLHGRTVTVKIRYGNFQTITRSATLDVGTDLTDELWQTVAGLFDRWARIDFAPVRLIGATAGQLTDQPAQLDLFEDDDRKKKKALDQALDQITDRFGAHSVHRGGGSGRAG